MKFRQFLALLLAAVTVSSLVACASDSDNPSDTTAADTTAEVTTAAPEVYYLDTLAKTTYDGITFTMAGESYDQRPNFCLEESTGATINDAIYERHMKLEQLYQINIDYESYASRTKATNGITPLVLANDDTYDLVFNAMTGGGMDGLAKNGVLTELYALNHLDFTQDHWAQTFVESMTVDGKLMYAAGGSSPSYYLSAMACFYNVDEATKRNFPNLYQLVLDGKWTADKMLELTTASLTDINGDGVYSPADDFYGLCQTLECGRGYFIGAGQSMAVSDGKGGWTIQMTSDEQVRVMDKLRSVYGTNPAVLTADSVQGTKLLTGTNTKSTKIGTFTSGHSMFATTAMMFGNQELRDMEATYGVLPVPKVDEDQKDYVAVSNPYAPCGTGIPKSATNIDMSAHIMEAMAFLGEEILRPAIYEITVHGKLAQDRESSAMLDIIYDDIYFDFQFCFNFGGLSELMRLYICADDENSKLGGVNFVTKYAEKAEETALLFEEFLAVLSGETPEAAPAQ